MDEVVVVLNYDAIEVAGEDASVVHVNAEGGLDRGLALGGDEGMDLLMLELGEVPDDCAQKGEAGFLRVVELSSSGERDLHEQPC